MYFQCKYNHLDVSVVAAFFIPEVSMMCVNQDVIFFCPLGEIRAVNLHMAWFKSARKSTCLKVVCYRRLVGKYFIILIVFLTFVSEVVCFCHMSDSCWGGHFRLDYKKEVLTGYDTCFIRIFMGYNLSWVI